MCSSRITTPVVINAAGIKTDKERLIKALMAPAIVIKDAMRMIAASLQECAGIEKPLFDIDVVVLMFFLKKKLITLKI